MLALDWSAVGVNLLVLFFLGVAIAMILVVLIQRPQGGGLSGAFGSASDGGAGQTAFGAKTGDVLTTTTILIFVLFLGTAIAVNYAIDRPDFLTADTAVTGDPEAADDAPPEDPPASDPDLVPEGLEPEAAPPVGEETTPPALPAPQPAPEALPETPQPEPQPAPGGEDDAP